MSSPCTCSKRSGTVSAKPTPAARGAASPPGRGPAATGSTMRSTRCSKLRNGLRQPANCGRPRWSKKSHSAHTRYPPHCGCQTGLGTRSVAATRSIAAASPKVRWICDCALIDHGLTQGERPLFSTFFSYTVGLGLGSGFAGCRAPRSLRAAVRRRNAAGCRWAVPRARHPRALHVLGSNTSCVALPEYRPLAVWRPASADRFLDVRLFSPSID